MRAAEDFEEFVAIVDHGSVSAAAEAAGLPRATLSRRLARLEERLGVRLLHRTTRRMTLTPAGELLHRKASRLVEAAREAEAEVRRLDGIPRGLLRVSIPPGTAHAMIASWVVEFLRLYPEVHVELIAHSVPVDLATEGIDLALRRGPVTDTSLIACTVNIDASVAVASPEYLTTAGTPQRPEDLERHNCIVGDRAGKLPQLRWPLLGGGFVPVAGTLMTNEMQLSLEAAKRGHGIALVSEYLARDDLDRGLIVRVLSDSVGRRERVNLLYIEREYLDPKVRAFVAFFVERVAAARP